MWLERVNRKTPYSDGLNTSFLVTHLVCQVKIKIQLDCMIEGSSFTGSHDEDMLYYHWDLVQVALIFTKQIKMNISDTTHSKIAFLVNLL